MLLCSASDLAIATAIKSETLRVEDCDGRFGPYVAISDDRGLIEVADDRREARERINAIAEAIA